MTEKEWRVVSSATISYIYLLFYKELITYFLIYLGAEGLSGYTWNI